MIRLWAEPAESKYLKYAWGLPTLYSAEGLFLEGEWLRHETDNSHQLMSRLIMCGGMPPLSNIHS